MQLLRQAADIDNIGQEGTGHAGEVIPGEQAPPADTPLDDRAGGPEKADITEQVHETSVQILAGEQAQRYVEEVRLGGDEFQVVADELVVSVNLNAEVDEHIGKDQPPGGPGRIAQFVPGDNAGRRQNRDLLAQNPPETLVGIDPEVDQVIETGKGEEGKEEHPHEYFQGEDEEHQAERLDDERLLGMDLGLAVEFFGQFLKGWHGRIPVVRSTIVFMVCPGNGIL